MVHTEVEIRSDKIDLDGCYSLRNIPFEKVPEELIRQIRPYADPFSYEEWLYWCPYFNKMPNYWNIALFDKEGKMIAFQYGTWDPCGAGMHIIRGIVHPSYYRASGTVLRRTFEDAKELARELGMKRIYIITCRHKAFLRKLPGTLRETEARVLEVVDV